ncbi:SusC/RagA family TonB-linked outer membrane protein [Mucilaginibacter sp. RS28]|uniref:SusC/RagA family TonB-linked outer membrane protein n=1 Tax=Mucilaginibacter straminoryzae TaxID=2932774 RepID=A0A9X1X1K9_9SPHI|nr:SusC/RagA family TonB-linked outer membrane protein [Mucilaginibacter straminoryzae]MCJ8209141.1 SusC/RagA family TonB-linked outer membrane protein [Mucilaginibacter straminoryzae]
MKKNLRGFKQTLRISFLICALLLQAGLIYSKTQGQSIIEKRLSVSFNNENLRTAIKKLEITANVDFAYDPAALHLQTIRVRSIQFSNERLDVILSALLQGTPIDFKEEVKGTVTLYKKPVASKAEGGKLTGKIVDEKGEPLPGATVRLVETNTGVLTQADGSFTINANPGTYTVIVSFISYQSKRIPAVKLSANETVSLGSITMVAESGTLNEVVVVGYGTQKKENLTGAVDQVTSKVLENRSMPNLTQGLQGTIPNLNLVPLDGKPIQSATYNIRGTTSIGQGGNALVLIDGVEGDPSRINPNDVASVSVLKDAASAAIYGARGAFGVVLITTKNPAKEKTSITYSFNQSFKKPTAVPDLVTNGYTFAKMFNDAWTAWNDYAQTPQNINKTVKFSPAYLAELQKRNSDPSLPKVDVNGAGEYVYYDNTDWYKLLYKDHNNAREHNIAVSGNSGKSDFLITGRYYGQDGLFSYNSDDYSIYNLRAKGSLQVYPWLRIYNNADYSNMKYHNPLNVGEGGGIWRNLQDEGHTVAPLFNPDGNLSYSAAYTVGDLVYGKNGIDMNNRVFRNTTGFATQFFDDVFRVKGDFTFQNTDNNQDRRRVPVPYSRKPGVIEYVGTATNDFQNVFQQTQYVATNVYGEFEPKWSKVHYFKALGGFNFEQSTLKRSEIVRNGLIYPDANNINLALGQSISTAGDWDRWDIMGGFYRLNYAFKDRYLVEADGRYDGSSKFPSNQRWAFFPSVSAGWRVSNEPFWKVSPKYISDLKIRASYGSLGNGSIASYAFQEKFNISQSGRVLNGVRPQTTSQPGVLPDGLTWETAQVQNLGVDMGLLGGKLTVTADGYIRKTKDMFTVGMTLPAVFGTGVPKGNYADLKTTGWEVTVAWRDRFNLSSKPFNYGLRLTLSDYTAEITKYNNPDKRLSDYYVGQKVGEIWGYQTAGYFTSAQDIASSPKQTLIKASTSGQLLPGDIKFADLDGNGVIDYGNNTVSKPGDRKIIGNTTPRYTYGVGLDADWNNFFFSAFIQGVGKRDWYPGPEASNFWGQYNRPYNKIPVSMLDKIWSPENPDAYFPRYRGYVAQNGSGELTVSQTKYIQDASYIRLKNIQIGYHLPLSWIKRVGMGDARVFVSAENIWTSSPLFKITKDIDPESIGRSDVILSPPNAGDMNANGSTNALSMNPPGPGISNSNSSGNANNYPILKSITLGLSVTF